MKKVLSLLMAFIMVLSAGQCLSVMSFAVDGNYESEPNNSKYYANTIESFDTDYIGSLDNRNDVDWYKFTITDDVDYFNVVFGESEHNENYINDGWDISIYRSASDDALKVTTFDGGYPYESPNLPYKGTFYIKVEANNKTDDDAPIDYYYDLEIVTNVGDEWENEINDNKSQANLIDNNAVYSGVTTNRNDVDWYKFKITGDVDYFTVVFGTNEHNENYTNNGWNISIYRSGTDTVLKSGTYDYGYPYEFPRLPYTGTFYIKIEANNKSENDAPIDCYYDLKIVTNIGNSWENEINDNKSQANLIANNTTYSGVTTNRNDTDWYRFVIGKDCCSFNVSFGTNEHNENYTNNGWNISIYKAGTDTVLKRGTYDSGYQYQSPRLPYTGTFYIKVEANNKSDDDAPIDCYYDLKVTTNLTHSYKTTTTKATETKDGKIVTACTACARVPKTVVIPKASSCKLSATSFTYDGKVKTPSVTVKTSKGTTLKNGTDYTLTYSSGRKNAGKHAVKITFKGNYSGTKMLYFYILPGKTSKLATAQTATSIKAAWKAVAGASGYLVTLYGSDNKAVRSVYTARTSYTFSKLASGTVYKVRVTAYKTIDKKNVLSKLYAQLTTATAPGTPTLKATAGTKKVSLSWNKQNGATGYVVYMSTSKNGKYSKVAVVKGNSAVSYTKTGLSTGNTYYFKVAAYKTCSDKNVYGSFSAVQGVKVK